MPAESGNSLPRVWSETQVRALGVSTDLVTAAAILGIGRTTAHTLVRADQFPVPVIRVGRRYRVPVAPILRLLALPTEQPPHRPTVTPPLDNDIPVLDPRQDDTGVGQGGQAHPPDTCPRLG